MCRIGDPEDVAAAAFFLAMDEVKFVSGAGMAVDGGAAVNLWCEAIGNDGCRGGATH